MLLGIGLGGFVDGIVFHQILQWHHMLTSAGYPADSVPNLEVNTLWDGLFHASTYVFVLLGLVIVFALDGSASTAQHKLSPALDLALGGILLVVAELAQPGQQRLQQRRRVHPGLDLEDAVDEGGMLRILGLDAADLRWRVPLGWAKGLGAGLALGVLPAAVAMMMGVFTAGAGWTHDGGSLPQWGAQVGKTVLILLPAALAEELKRTADPVLHLLVEETGEDAAQRVIPTPFVIPATAGRWIHISSATGHE